MGHLLVSLLTYSRLNRCPPEEILDHIIHICYRKIKMGDSKDNLLGISWHDSAWIPILNPTNVMDYFMERSNPFYDRTCNNESIKMQRLNMEQLSNMTGIEYMLLHVQEPILYVVRKQHRHSAAVVTTLADYYIIAGVVYQAPDIGSVINSRTLTTVNHLQGAFDEARQFSRYHPSKGYCGSLKIVRVKNKRKKVRKQKRRALVKKPKKRPHPCSRGTE